MQVAGAISEVREAIAAARRAGKSIGVVPTMGALHAGHLSLVDASRRECGFTVATIFVNPTQFAPGEDLAKYPRPLDADLAKLKDHGADLTFVPGDGEMYGPHYGTFVEVGSIARPLEGAHRATHFRGVATVVLKLFNIVQADRAYFGQKDFQQTLVVKRMVADLNVPTEIRVCPTVREPDGLAMSSRNAYLSPENRQRALGVSRSLREAAQLVSAGETNAATLLLAMRKVLEQAGITEIDYVALVNPESLDNLSEITGPALAVLAVRVGTTRLIDNELLAADCRP